MLNYDFDARETMPREIQREFQAELNEIRANHLFGDTLFCFRDPRTVDALLATDDSIRQLFATSGFGMVPSGGRLPAGRFLAAEAEQRTFAAGKVLLKFRENREQFLAAERGDFKIKDFFLQTSQAQPLQNSDGLQELQDVEQKLRSLEQTLRSRQPVSFLRGFGRAATKFLARVLFVAGVFLLIVFIWNMEF